VRSNYNTNVSASLFNTTFGMSTHESAAPDVNPLVESLARFLRLNRMDAGQILWSKKASELSSCDYRKYTIRATKAGSRNTIWRGERMGRLHRRCTNRLAAAHVTDAVRLVQCADAPAVRLESGGARPLTDLRNADFGAT
jgi:hypothetical protein